MRHFLRRLYRTAAICILAALAGCKPKLTIDQQREILLKTADQTAAQGPFKMFWDSLQSVKIPQWYVDGKFGVFVQYGVYAVPAFGDEDYPRAMYWDATPAFAYHVKTYGPQSAFGYKDFIPQFTAAQFNASRLADLFKSAGARYVVVVAEHADGFPMYDCSLTDWSAVKMGPKRDILGELASAIRSRNMVFGAASRRGEHWWYFDGGRQFESDVKSPSNAGLYEPAQPRATSFGDPSQPDEAFLADWFARTSELVDKYQPQVLQLDGWVELAVFRPYLQKLVAAYYNRGVEWKREVIVNYLDKSLPERAGVQNVKVLPVEANRPDFWQADLSVSNRSRGYIRDDELRPVDSLVDDLVDVVSKNGALLLAVGPTAEGTIPPAVENTLLEIGKWLDANGEAIYGTRPWKVFGEGPASGAPAPDQETARKPYTGQDVRFTTKSDAIYAIALAWPAGGKLVIKSLADYPVKSVELLGSPGALKWAKTAGGLSVELPAQPVGQYAFAFKIL